MLRNVFVATAKLRCELVRHDWQQAGVNTIVKHALALRVELSRMRISKGWVLSVSEISSSPLCCAVFKTFPACVNKPRRTYTLWSVVKIAGQ